MNTAAERLKNPWLTLARLVWIVLVLLSLGVFVAGIPDYYQKLLSLTALTGLQGEWNPETLSAALTNLNLSTHSFVVISLIQNVVQLSVYAGVGFLIFWRKSDTWLGLFTSFVLIGIGTTIGSGIETLEAMNSPWQELVTFAGALMWPALFIFLFIFPDGRFVPRWTRLFIVIWGLFYLWWAVTDLILKLPLDTFQTFGPFFLIISLAFSLGSQVYRYLRVSGPAERQQTKWFLFAIAMILGYLAFENLFLDPWLASGSLTHPQMLLVDLVLKPVGLTMAMTLLPISIGIALFRYHLWDIDILIRRTVLYGSLTALLGLVYFGIVVFLQELFGRVSGQANSPLAIVISTLAIAALIGPLRVRLQNFIDRRFFRQKYNAEQALEAFARSARDEVELEALTTQIVAIVQETIQPEVVRLWLKNEGRFGQQPAASQTKIGGKS